METRYILMVFEELIQLLLQTRQSVLISRGLRIENLPSAFALTWDNLRRCPSFQEWLEKYQRTWWEVLWSAHAAEGQSWIIQQCLYIADSLSDAIRLRPHMTISFRSFTPTQIESVWEQQKDWEEQSEWLEESEIGQSL
jgi:hypothetical protein